MDTSFKLPIPFWVVWVIEIWERFGYYTVAPILSIFFVRNLGYSEADALDIMGVFMAFAYGFIYVGGWLGDHVIGTKRMILIGAIILICAYAFLALSNSSTIYYALGMIIVGSSLFKANPSSLISKMFKKGQQRQLDAAMTLYYIAVNIGSFTSIIVSPFVANYISYQAAFWLAAIGLIIGTLSYCLMYRKLEKLTSPAGSLPFTISKTILIGGGAIASAILLGMLLQHPELSFIIIWIVVIAGFGSFAVLAYRYPSIIKKRMLAALLLMVCAVFFFVLYNQQNTTLTFLALHSIDRNWFGIVIPASAYQMLNPLTIITMGVVLARVVYPRMHLSHSQKFAIGFLLSGIAFGLMYFMSFINDGHGHISTIFLLCNYFFQSVGELFISALGVAMVAELCPRKMSGYVMGLWFMSSMLAGPIGAWVGQFTTASASISNQGHLYLYAKTFGILGVVAFGFGVVLWIFSRQLNVAISHPHKRH